MKYYLIFLLCAILLAVGCSPYVKIDYDNEALLHTPPPGTKQIGENLFVDYGEMETIGYREFMFWIDDVYGTDSEEYQLILPDTTVWFNQDYKDYLHQIYMNHPTFNSYPVVGVSLEQAKKYTRWRTDRVTQAILTRKKIIAPLADRTPANHFTVERYLNGTYEGILKKEDILVPAYRIPTAAEWEYFAKGNSNFRYGVDSLSRSNRKESRQNGGYLFCTNEYVHSEVNRLNSSISEPYELTRMTRLMAENVFGLSGIIGNVSEMVLEEGVSKGGSWRDSIPDIEITKNFTFDKSNEYTGFRNICSWEWMKVKY